MVSPEGESSSPVPWRALLQPHSHTACTLCLPAELEGLLTPSRKETSQDPLERGGFGAEGKGYLLRHSARHSVMWEGLWPVATRDPFSPGNPVFSCSLLCLYMSLRGEIEIGGGLVGLEIRVVLKDLGQEGQSAGKVF